MGECEHNLAVAARTPGGPFEMHCVRCNELARDIVARLTASLAAARAALPASWQEMLDQRDRLTADLAASEAERERMREALEGLREMMSPKNRQRFVMGGPMAFASIYRIVEAALSASPAPSAAPPTEEGLTAVDAEVCLYWLPEPDSDDSETLRRLRDKLRALAHRPGT